jgi:hypothetical protein
MSGDFTQGFFKSRFLRGINGRPMGGTFVANGATPVVVANTNITANSVVVFGLRTVGGTVSPNGPAMVTVTAGTGFNAAATAGDTSTYNYLIIQNA